MDGTLSSVTGIAHIDNIVRALIDTVEASFPGRVRSYYLGGSYSDGTAVGGDGDGDGDGSPHSSDVDLFVIFRDTIREGEAATFQRLVAACQLLSPTQIDAHPYAEDDLLRGPQPRTTQASFLNALITVAGVPVYGDDIRAALPAVPFPRYVLDVIESGLFPIGVPRQRDIVAYPLPTPLAPPLTYPDPDGEFYGYDAVPARPAAPRGTRRLVSSATWIATLILAVETGRLAGQKSQSIRLCKEYLPDGRRTRLAAAIFDTCKGEWGYALPTGAEERARLRDLCRDMLALENEYVTLCRGYVLAQLRGGGDDEKWQATRILRNVVYRDDELAAALEAVGSAGTDDVRAEAAKALEMMTR